MIKKGRRSIKMGTHFGTKIIAAFFSLEHKTCENSEVKQLQKVSDLKFRIPFIWVPITYIHTYFSIVCSEAQAGETQNKITYLFIPRENAN